MCECVEVDGKLSECLVDHSIVYNNYWLYENRNIWGNLKGKIKIVTRKHVLFMMGMNTSFKTFLFSSSVSPKT